MRIVVASRPVDLRNGLDGLATLVPQAYQSVPAAVARARFSERVFHQCRQPNCVVLTIFQQSPVRRPSQSRELEYQTAAT